MKLLSLFLFLFIFKKIYCQDSTQYFIVEKEELINSKILEIDSNKLLDSNRVSGSDSLFGEFSGQFLFKENYVIQKIDYNFFVTNKHIQLILCLNQLKFSVLLILESPLSYCTYYLILHKGGTNFL